MGRIKAHEGPSGTAAPTARRILIYGMNYAPEMIGVGRYTGEIGAYLQADGDQIEVVTTPPHYPGWAVRDSFRNRYSVARSPRMSVFRCPLLLRKRMRGVWRVLAPLSFAVTSAPVVVWRILTTRPEVVLVVEPTLFAAPVALVAAKLVRARTVLHVQDLEIDAAFAVGHLKSGLLQRAAQAFERFILRHFDHVITISNQMGKRLLGKGVRADQLSMVRNWADLEQIRRLDGPNAFRTELALPDSTFVALYAGNIGAKQALHVVTDAAARLVDETGIVFVIAGDGPEREKLVAHQLPNVRFLPLQPESLLCELLNLADVHVLPQDKGAADLVMPSKLAGMLASGRPVLAMTNPDTEIHDFLAGEAILIPAGDSLQLAESIRQLARSDPSSRPPASPHLAAAFDRRRSLPALAALLAKRRSTETFDAS